MKSSKLRWGVSLVMGVVAIVGLAGKSLYNQARATAQAYIYGYPLVIMELTKQHQVTLGTSKLNDLKHHKIFPDAHFNGVVSPNVDTLYSIGHLDLRSEPVVLSIPSTAGHYYMMPILDGWTNVVASPGTRTIGEDGKTYLIVGPTWQGEVPLGMELIRVPTQMGWIIGRFKSSGPKDYDEVNALQVRFKLQTLSAWQGLSHIGAATLMALPRLDIRTAPDKQLSTWSQDEFFSTLCSLLPDNPPRATDTGQLANLRDSGLLSDGCSGQQSTWQRLGSQIGYQKVLALLADKKGLIDKLPVYDGWRIGYDLGEYGTRYNQRAVVAKLGLGANEAKDAIYPNTFEDSSGQRLTGDHRYVVHFAKEDLPPVKAFWSLTLYNDQQFLSDNPLSRYALGDRDDLNYNLDGSLDLYIQHDQPEKVEQRSNWLPAPNEEFSLFLRLYWPQTRVLDKQWLPPHVQRQG